MIDGQTVLAIIPARGGSKGVKRKNIREVAGKPLISWTIEEAKKSRYIDRLVLSSDDLEIIEIAKEWGCEVPFVRPKALAHDHSSGLDPVIHAINEIPGYDYIVLLQPTSPLRIVDDIDTCIENCIREEADSCVSVTESNKSPYWMYKFDNDGRISPVIKTEQNISRRQDLPKAYKLNGAVFVSKCNSINKNLSFITDNTIAYLMPEKRSLDIDTELDIKVLELIINEGE